MFRRAAISLSYLSCFVELYDLAGQDVSHAGVEPNQVARAEVPGVVHPGADAALGDVPGLFQHRHALYSKRSES